MRCVKKTSGSGKGMNRRQFLKTTVAGCAALGLSTVGFPSIAFPKTAMKVGYLPILDHLAVLVSHARDNSSLKNISIEPMMFKSWESLAGALKAGVIEGGLVLSNFAMDMFNHGTDIKSILVGHRNGSGITVRKDASISSPSGLKGKTIAIPAQISTHTAILDKYLKDGGLSLKDVTTKVIAPPNMLMALKEGSIDAFIVAEPFCEKAKMEGAGKILVLSKDVLPNHICCIVVVGKQALKNNPEGIREWVHSLQRNGRFIDQDKAGSGSREVAGMAKKYLPYDEQTIVNVMLHPNNRITYSDLTPKVSDYKKIHDISVSAGLIQKTDLEGFIDETFSKG